MGEELRGTPLLPAPPPPKPLTVFCSFLDPSFILGRVRSQTHQVKPGGSSGVSPEPSHQHGAGGSWGSALAGFQLFSPIPHFPKHPQRLPPAPGDPPSTDQEGITIFMLRVTGIRGLQGEKLGGVSSKVRETNGGRGQGPQDVCPRGLQQAGAAGDTRRSLGDPSWDPQAPRAPGQALTRAGRCISRRGGGWRREHRPSCAWGEREEEGDQGWPEHSGGHWRI